MNPTREPTTPIGVACGRDTKIILGKRIDAFITKTKIKKMMLQKRELRELSFKLQ
jgi:hypothetical protein